MENNKETDIVEDSVVEDSAPNRTENDTEQELLLKIEELDDAWNDLTIKRRNLYEQKNSMEQQAKALNREKITQQTKLRKLKSTKKFSVFMLYFVAVILAYVIYSYENTNYNSNRSMLAASHNEKINTVDTSRDNMIQQINDLQVAIVRQEEVIEQRKQAEQEALARQEKELAQQKLAEQQTALKEELASQGGLSGIADTILTEENSKELDTYIASLNRYPTHRIQQKKIDGVYYYEVVHKYELGKYLLSGAGNSVVYPGAIIRGDSLMQGSADYSLVSQERNPITLTCSRGGSVRLEDVSYGNVNEAVKQLWDESHSGYSDKWEYSLRTVRDNESIEMSLGIGAANVGSVNFGINQKESTSTMAIIYTETYFSVAAEPLSSATQYFKSGCDLEKLGNYEPAYVSSVDYGRMIVILVTAELSESELSAQLKANIQGVDIGADIKNIKENIEGRVEIYRYGGDSGKSLRLINLNSNKNSGGLKGWWDKNIKGEKDIDIAVEINNILASDDSLINPVPLEYHLNYLSDNSSVPAIAIINDDIILKETARLVTLTLKGNIEGTFRLSDSANAIGYVLNTNQIQITKKGETSGEIQFIWDSSNPNSLTGFFNDSSFSCSMSEIPEETDYVYELECESGWFSQKSTKITIYISGAVYETP